MEGTRWEPFGQWVGSHAPAGSPGRPFFFRYWQRWIQFTQVVAGCVELVAERKLPSDKFDRSTFGFFNYGSEYSEAKERMPRLLDEQRSVDDAVQATGEVARNRLSHEASIAADSRTVSSTAASSATGMLRACAENLVNLVCPPECVWCSLPTPNRSYFCDECRHALVSDYHRCQRCATAIPSVVPNQDCFRCREAGWKFSRVITLGPYRGRRREAIILIKKPSFETLRIGLGRLLGKLVAAELVTNGLGVASEDRGALIVPVPYHWTHTFAGAAFTANSLARSISQETGLPVSTRVARRTRKTAKQGMLSWSERRQNVRGAFEIRRAQELTGRHVLLVDDVLTSGATTGELASHFLKAGAARVSVVVVARGTGTKERSPETK